MKWFNTLFVIGFSLLVASIVWSGYSYMFDGDEISQIQKVFLIASGFTPYVDFFSIYSPVFSWFLLPLFLLKGFSFDSIFFARIVMIMIFFLRVGVTAFMIRKIFSRPIAVLFVVLLLLDPFTIFSGMQIRPDNLMMLIFSLGLLSLVSGRIIVSGILFSLALLVSIKIVPSLVAVYSVYLFWKRSDVKKIVGFIAATFVPIFLFGLYTWTQGYGRAMVDQLLIDAPKTNASLIYPVKLGNYYWPDNIYVFGFSGRPLTWIYVWVLPMLAFVGSFVVFQKSTIKSVNIPKLLFVFLFFASWGSLFFIHSVFLQYYLPVTWLFALFAAVAVFELVYSEYKIPYFRQGLIVCIALSIASVGFVSIRANNLRAKMNGDEYIQVTIARWEQIPQGSVTFPNVLFRLPGYPLITGYYWGDIPQSIHNKFGPLAQSLEKTRTSHLLLNEDYLSKLPGDAQEYIKTHYERVGGDSDLWTITTRK